jgi:putative Mg2+ transporter-C (MgtC) family protein
MNMTSSILLMSSRDLLLAIVLGVLIGLERKLVQKEVGMRTFSLISLGSALFVMISRLSMSMYLGNSSLDPSRTLGQIIVGIGFLGAGAIIFEQREGKVRGLTTAAMMWVTAAIGSAVGLGLYGIAILVTIFVMLINLIILPIERRLDRK